MTNDTKILNVTDQEAMTIMNSLAGRPYGEVYQLIQKLSMQLQEQSKPKQPEASE